MPHSCFVQESFCFPYERYKILLECRPFNKEVIIKRNHRGKQEKLFYEVIFQIGNKDDMNVQSSEGQLAKDILCEFMEQFQKRNPNLYVFSSHLNMDEQTPHIHIDFVPFIRNSKRGLDTRVSLKGALAEQGFKGGWHGGPCLWRSNDRRKCGICGGK